MKTVINLTDTYDELMELVVPIGIDIIDEANEQQVIDFLFDEELLKQGINYETIS